MSTGSDSSWIGRGLVCLGSGLASGVLLGMLLERHRRRTASPAAGKFRNSSELIKSGDSVYVEQRALERLVAACLRSAGAPEAKASLVAEVLVAADRRGVTSHGVNRAEMYCGELRAGLIDAGAEPHILRETASVANVDGRNGLGAVVSKFAMELAIKKAKESGIGLVVCSRSNHFGIAGYWSQLALQEGLVGFAFTNTSPWMVPTRGLTRAGGTNPISCYCPAGTDSFQLDMATTTVPVGKVEVCHRKGEPIPPGWAVGGSGELTTDPAEALLHGGVTPLGGAEETAGYKGYGLNMMVEILCGVLSGCPDVGPDVPPWRVDRGVPVGYGHCFMCIDPKKLLPGGSFEGSMAAYLTRMRGLKAANPALAVLVPGDPERAEEAEVERLGVRLNTRVCCGLRELARGLGCAAVLPEAMASLPEDAVAGHLLV